VQRFGTVNPWRPVSSAYTFPRRRGSGLNIEPGARQRCVTSMAGRDPFSAESVKNEERQALERSRPRPVLSHAKAIGATLVFATGGKPSDLGVFAARLVS